MLRSPLIHFLLLGGVLFLIEAAWSRVPERPIIEVQRSEIAARLDGYRKQMGRRPTPEEAKAIETMTIEDAIWLDEAFAIGLAEIDPVVRQRLLLNMRFLEAQNQGQSEDGLDASDAELLERATRLGMDRSDTVVQRRLVDRVQAIIRAGVRAQPPDEETLAAHYAQTAERWREPALLDLSHVYLSRDKRGEKTEADALQLLQRLRSESVTVEDAVALADPFLGGHRLRGASPARIIARLGPGFAEGLKDAPVGQWVGPVESAFGEHLVWVHDRRESRIPPLEEIRKRVVEDWFEEACRRALRDHIARRRERVEVRMVE